MNKNKSIIIRADGSSQIGTGHLMRCVALAQGIAKVGLTPIFITKKIDDVAEKIFSRYKFQPHFIENNLNEQDDASLTIEIAAKNQAEIIAIDHYKLKETFRSEILENGFETLVFDDVLEDEKISATYILNQNLGAESLLERYKEIAPETKKYMLGEKYVLLREKIIKIGKKVRKERPTRISKIAIGEINPNILIIFGGSDIKDLTALTLEQFKNFDNNYDNINVVCGLGMKKETEKKVEELSKTMPRVNVLKNPDLSKLMSQTDIAITAAGTTTHELAYFGIPMVLVQIADNQSVICENFSKRNLAEVITDLNNFEPQLIEILHGIFADIEQTLNKSKMLINTIDSKGIKRILNII